VHKDSTVTLALVDADLPTPGPEDVVVRIEAAPINPSDLGVMFARAEMSTVVRDTRVGAPVVRATLSPEAMQAAAGRIGLTIPAGNEGGGVVVAAGASDAAQALLGKSSACGAVPCMRSTAASPPSNAWSSRTGPPRWTPPRVS
jgi:NADPH:quinone reductase-like Zn-dependent oxidoreductase